MALAVETSVLWSVGMVTNCTLQTIRKTSESIRATMVIMRQSSYALVNFLKADGQKDSSFKTGLFASQNFGVMSGTVLTMQV